MADIVKALVDGGKASAGPPLGPALGPMGVNIMQVINAINEKTKNFQGMKVPVKIIINPKTKDFEIEIGTPPAASLILNEIGIEKGSGSPFKHKIGNITVEQAIKIAKMKDSSLLGKNIKQKTKEVIGTCQSIGVTVEGKPAREIQKAIANGDFDGKFS
ncbi:MAG: 50S ribosomal protein L11 [Candidatus Thermoplasmatota archaeon]|nr:50S ribosomal protein L11 [Candidatus Thermoplasmatota archaeon]MBU1941715.1 50S ribosomal protein L11 [Candidatus Thermoplasmatota archaeon]